MIVDVNLNIFPCDNDNCLRGSNGEEANVEAATANGSEPAIAVSAIPMSEAADAPEEGEEEDPAEQDDENLDVD